MRKYADVQMILIRLHIFFRLFPFNTNPIVEENFGLVLA